MFMLEMKINAFEQDIHKAGKELEEKGIGIFKNLTVL